MNSQNSYQKQGKWINEHEYGKWLYYDDDLDLITTKKSSGSELYNDIT